MQPTTLKAVRLTHLYSGVFLAPAILFFAITGGLQMFGLHETSRGSSYVPPAILVHLSRLHKKATLTLPPSKPAPATTAAKSIAPPQAPAPVEHLPMKIFFGIVALGLIVSTLSGILMAFKYTRRKIIPALVLLAGIVLPLILLPF